MQLSGQCGRWSCPVWTEQLSTCFLQCPLFAGAACCKTSNVTGCHRGSKQKLPAGYRVPSRHRRAMCRHSYFCLLDVVDCNARHIFHRRVWYCEISLRYTCIWRSGIILIPLSYLGAKFSFCRTLHCWASPWRQIRYSINHSVTHPAYLMQWELLLRNSNHI